MKCGRGVLFDAKSLAHFDREAAHESGVSIVNENVGESYAFENMFQLKFGDSFCCYRLVAWDQYDGFGAVMICNREY